MSHSLKRGLETYGHAVVKELEQLHDCRTIHPRFAAELSNAEKRQAPAYFMFIKKNDVLRSRDGYVATATNKGCYKTKEDTSSPMVWTELLLLLYCFVDAKERRQVTTCQEHFCKSILTGSSTFGWKVHLPSYSPRWTLNCTRSI